MGSAVAVSLLLIGVSPAGARIGSLTDNGDAIHATLFFHARGTCPPTGSLTTWMDDKNTTGDRDDCTEISGGARATYVPSYIATEGSFPTLLKGQNASVSVFIRFPVADSGRVTGGLQTRSEGLCRFPRQQVSSAAEVYNLVRLACILKSNVSEADRLGIFIEIEGFVGYGIGYEDDHASRLEISAPAAANETGRISPTPSPAGQTPSWGPVGVLMAFLVVVAGRAGKSLMNRR